VALTFDLLTSNDNGELTVLIGLLDAQTGGNRQGISLGTCGPKLNFPLYHHAEDSQRYNNRFH